MPCFPTLLFAPFFICSPQNTDAGRTIVSTKPVASCPAAFNEAGIPEGAVSCRCSADAVASGSVWGIDIYTADSSICRAALHAGAVGTNGGVVTVEPAAGRASYSGTARHGVASDRWGRFDNSFRFVGPTPPPAETTTPVAACPNDFRELAAAGRPVTCSCTAEATSEGSVWGTDVYTADSRICRAALHAGAIGPQGGTVTLVGEPGRQAYTGVSRNSVASDSWGAYETSYRFAMAGAAPGASRVADCPANFTGSSAAGQSLTCVCSADATASGSVWGTDVYTADSKICRAAVHAGATAAQGGPVTVVPLPGRRRYTGAFRNGVTTESWGAFEASFRFDAISERGSR